MIIEDPREAMCRPVYAPVSINVIEHTTESYDQYHKRKVREEQGNRVPFGFARALAEGGK